jgi:hypothetical protein
MLQCSRSFLVADVSGVAAGAWEFKLVPPATGALASGDIEDVLLVVTWTRSSGTF